MPTKKPKKKGNSKNGKGNIFWQYVIAERRLIVSQLRLRGSTHEQIPPAMLHMHEKRVEHNKKAEERGLSIRDNRPYINPETNKPWATSRIGEDIIYLERKAIELGAINIGQWKGNILEKLEYTQTVAWNSDMDTEKKLTAVHASIGKEIELLGFKRNYDGVPRDEILELLTEFKDLCLHRFPDLAGEVMLTLQLAIKKSTTKRLDIPNAEVISDNGDDNNL